MGPGTPDGNIRVWYCFCFVFVRERDVNEIASSDTGKAVSNEMRVQINFAVCVANVR